MLRLTDGAVPFVSNAQNMGWGNATYMPQGPMAAIKTFSDGTEVAYSVIRGDSRFDGNWDSQFGEMMLNDNTITGLQAGYVRWLQYGNFGSSGVGYEFPPSDESPHLSIAGDYLFGGHWALGLAVNINNRNSERGTYNNPITTTTLPHFAASVSSGGFNTSHYRASSFALEPDYRAVPYGFYIYYDQGNVYDRFWSGSAFWVISDNILLYVSGDGALIALENGQP